MNFQYQSNPNNLAFKPQFFTNAIKQLLLANLLLFIFRNVAQNQFDLADIFGLSPSNFWPMIWQPFTYMFIHGDFFHLFMNMFVLWMFGSEMESIWGKNEFLKYYFITGIGSGLIWTLFNLDNPYSVLIGASGSIYGLLLAYGMMFPDRKILIYFLFPIKVKYFVVILGAISFFSAMGSGGSNISHLTHLSGMIVGLIYIKFPKKFPSIKTYFNSKIIQINNQQKQKSRENNLRVQRDIDVLLDKIQKEGFESLTDKEKDQLYAKSKFLGKNIDKN